MLSVKYNDGSGFVCFITYKRMGHQDQRKRVYMGKVEL